MKDNFHRNKDLVDKLHHRFNNGFYQRVMDRKHCIDKDDQPHRNNFDCFHMERTLIRIIGKNRQDSSNRLVDVDDSEMKFMSILSQRV